MRANVLRLAVIIFVLGFVNIARADCEHQLEKLIGWSIVDVKTIEGFQEPGKIRKKGFEGCNGSTKIFFTDGSIAECVSLGLQLELMPKAIILGNKTTYQGKEIVLLKMLVSGHIYDIFVY